MGREKGKTGQRTDVWWYTSWTGCTDLHPRSKVDEVLALAVVRYVLTWYRVLWSRLHGRVLMSY